MEHLLERRHRQPAGGRLYEFPYTDLSPAGVDGVFTADATSELMSVLEDVRQRAAALG